MERNAAVRKVAADAHSAVDRAANGATEAAEEVARSAKPILDRATQVAHDAVDRAAAVAVPTANWLNDKADVLRTAPDKIVANSRRLVSRHPLKSVGIAIAVGVLLAAVLR